jgi:hypothetical protein
MSEKRWWVSLDNDPDHGYDVHGPGGYWVGPSLWDRIYSWLMGWW